MCSSTRGPAMTPSRVTWPISSTAVPVVFAWRTRLAVDSRSCVTAPGAASTAASGHGLDRVDDEHFRAGLGDVLEDPLDRGLGDERERAGVHGEPARAFGHLAHGFLAGRVQHGPALGERRRALQEQRRLADPGSPPIRVTEPGTRPPPRRGQIPRNRSSSALPASVARRAIGSGRSAARRLGRNRARAARRKLRACSTRRTTGIVRSIAVHRRRRTNRRILCGAWPSSESVPGSGDASTQIPARASLLDCGPGRGFCHKLLKIRPLPVSVRPRPVYDSWIRVAMDRSLHG